MIIASLMWLSLLMFLNFAFLERTMRIFGQTIAQVTTGFVFLLVAYYFMRKASKLLLKKKTWQTVL